MFMCNTKTVCHGLVLPGCFQPAYSTSAVAKFYLLLHTKPKAVEMGCFAISNDSDFAVWLLLFFILLLYFFHCSPQSCRMLQLLVVAFFQGLSW